MALSEFFARFALDNYEVLDSGRGMPGYARLFQHIGKPPGKELEADLIQRLHIQSLRVYLHGEQPDEICWYSCCLFLDESGLLCDIWYSPDVLNRKAGAVFERRAVS